MPDVKELTEEERKQKVIGRIGESKSQVLDYFAEGRKFYKLMMFEEAAQCFLNALKIDKNDGPSKIYAARCKHYIENPPPEDWDGVWVMTTK